MHRLLQVYFHRIELTTYYLLLTTYYLLQVYFHRFELSPIRLNITYLHSQKLVADLIRNPASTLLPNLDRAPIVLDAMVLQDTVTTAEELQSAIKLSYKSALLRQFYKLLLRVDMLSVPVRS